MTLLRKLAVGIVMFLLSLGCITIQRCQAQSETATVSGTITDPSGALLVGAKINIINDDTNVSVETETNGAGVYNIPSLRPGRYHMLVQLQGFKQVAVRDLILNVQDVVNRNFTLQIGGASETIQVTAEGLNVNTTDASVSTVVNRQFLQEIPLNGRSIQTLLALTPGVVFTNPGGGTSSQGQFSVNGMRTDANYFTIDGVAANLGTDSTGNGLPEAAAGSSPGWNVMGGTNGLVSVDAIQEFRVQTSSFAPEYGRTPGAQVGMVTRSGTNAWHGTAFDYLRNDLFDATDWFNGYTNNPPLAKPKERQNDFGGVFGGPILKDKTFFFFSYEGLRLRQPKTLETLVPDDASRAAAPAEIQPYMAAFPVANGPEAGDGLAQLNAAASYPSSLDAYSIRVDQVVSSKLRVFARYAYSPSTTSSGIPSDLYTQSVTTHTFTLGGDETFSSNVNNELRLNYSNLKSQSQYVPTTAYGAALPPPASQLYPAGVNPASAKFTFGTFYNGGWSVGSSGYSEQRQANLVDNLSISNGHHNLRFGVDFRWLAPFTGGASYSQSNYFLGVTGPYGMVSGQAYYSFTQSFADVSIRSKNTSLYAQDTWKVLPRLTLTYGLRWDVNPAPKGNTQQNDPWVVQGLSNPETMTVAPPGTPLYPTTWDNFAPRVGVAYQLRDKNGWETVLRGGIGRFNDIGAGGLGLYTLGSPFRASNVFIGPNFPLTSQQASTPAVNAAPYYLTVAEPGLVLPRTYQWNVAVEQSLGSKQAFSITYLGSLGKDLLRTYNISPLTNPQIAYVSVTSNQGASNYQALQAQFQRRVSAVQALVSYTWSHSIDNASDDYSGYTPVAVGSPSIDRGNSAFDVRHSVSGALTYDIPAPFRNRLTHMVLGGWSVTDLVIGRTGLPVDLTPDYNVVGPYTYYSRPNVVPGVPLYLYGSQYPGGKAFNGAAFTDSAPGTQGNLGRNTLRGFGAWQDNFAVHRQFNVTERVHLQFRAEAFNLFNHPNFGDPSGYYPLSYPQFGQSYQTLANSLSFSGLNSMYQIGGPRSWQFGLKLEF